MSGTPSHKVLFCIDALVRGGTELQLLGLIERLDRRRFQPYLLTLRPTPPELLPADCPHLCWQVPRLFSAHGLRSLLRLAHWLREERVGVVQTYFQDSTIFGIVAARLAGVPVRLACFRDLGFWRTRGQILLLRQVYRQTTGFLCNADVVRDRFVEVDGLAPDDFEVIRNGVEVEAHRWIDHAGPTVDVGLVGNLTREVKRADLFIRAAARVARDHPEVRWHLVGDGHLRPGLEALAEAEGIADRVVFAGRIAGVGSYLEKMQVGVMCSDSEGFSNALLEYMLKGCAVVATDVGGNAEAVQDGETGLLVPVDDVVALAGALRLLIEDTSRRRRLSVAARAWVAAGFGWQKSVDEHMELYGQRLASVGSTGVNHADS